MEKVQGNVFMSCVVGGMYQEFKLEEEAVKELSICLKNEINCLSKNNSMNSHSLKKVKLLHSLVIGDYLSLAAFYEDENEDANAYLKEILTNLPMKKFFQLQMSQVPEWFYYLGKYAKAGSSQEYKLQEKMFHEGLKNTEYLSRLGLDLISDQFVCIEKQKEVVENKPVLFVKSAKKIS